MEKNDFENKRRKMLNKIETNKNYEDNDQDWLEKVENENIDDPFSIMTAQKAILKFKDKKCRITINNKKLEKSLEIKIELKNGDFNEIEELIKFISENYSIGIPLGNNNSDPFDFLDT
jgi:hypothetical protein